MSTSYGGPWVQTACFCERVLQEADGVVSAIRIVDRMFIQVYPGAGDQPLGPMQIHTTMLIMLKSGDARGTHDVEVKIEAPSGITMQQFSASVLLEGEDRGSNLIVELDLAAQETGLYWFNISIGDHTLTRMPLRVVRQQVSHGGS